MIHCGSKVRYFFWEFDVFFLFLRAVVNMPIQTLIIPPWLLLRKMIISQLELGPPVVKVNRRLLLIHKIISIYGLIEARWSSHSWSLGRLWLKLCPLTYSQSKIARGFYMLKHITNSFWQLGHFHRNSVHRKSLPQATLHVSIILSFLVIRYCSHFFAAD